MGFKAKLAPEQNTIMRFKAKLAPEQVTLLYNVIVPISRLATSSSSPSSEGVADSLHRNGSILYMDTNRLCISTKGQSSDTDGIVCFAELQAASGIFLEHRIESADNNVICMELDLSQLRMALQSISIENKSSRADTNNNSSSSRHHNVDTSSLQGSTQGSIHTTSLLSEPHNVTILQLAKRSNISCLCLDAVSTTSSGANITVHHTIPVRILRPTEMQFHLPPQIPLPDVQLELTGQSTAMIKTVVERLKSLSPTVYLSANMTGELTVRLDSGGASIRTFLSKVHPRPEDCKPGVEACCVMVDTKKLAASLQWQTGSGGFGGHNTGGGSNNGNHALVSSTLFCLVPNEMLILHAILQPASVGFFTYYVPVHYLSADPRGDYI
jgi:hypothetical protein